MDDAAMSKLYDSTVAELRKELGLSVSASVAFVLQCVAASA